MRSRYGGRAYGGSALGLPGDQSSGLLVPGFDAVFFWTTSGGAGGYGQVAYGGRRATAHPSAGLFASPDHETGRVTIPLWWAYAPYVNLTRVCLSSGRKTPVRGASPFQTSGRSYHNGVSNPKAAVDLVGVSAGSNTALDRLDDIETPSAYVTTAFRMTAEDDGTVSMTDNTDGLITLDTTRSFYVRTSALADVIRLSVQWYDHDSASVGTRTYEVNETAREQAVGEFSWASVDVDHWPDGAVVGVASYQATGLDEGDTVDITARLSEVTTSARHEYFDGDYPGGAWRGTPGASPSDLAPIMYAVDGEAPQDQPIRYELTNPLIPGYVASSNTVTLRSGGRRSWLTHPSSASTPIPAWILGPFGPLTRAIEQGVYYPLDSTDGLPIVRTQSTRRGRQGTVRFLALDHSERDRLLRMFQDGSPVLVRPPGTYGEGGGIWMSLGEITEESATWWSEFPYRTLSAPFYEVAPPLVANAEVTV